MSEKYGDNNKRAMEEMKDSNLKLKRFIEEINIFSEDDIKFKNFVKKYRNVIDFTPVFDYYKTLKRKEDRVSNMLVVRIIDIVPMTKY